MSRIYVSTRAYNAEPYIGRAIESILSQTHTNWVYYICNNGSTDRTGEIIEEYADKDSRIKTFHNKENHVYTEESNEFHAFIYNLKDGEYWCVLDADDEYTPDFMEKTLSFMENNDLDAVMTEYEQIEVEENTSKRMQTTLSADTVVAQHNFDETFVGWFPTLSHMWAILYSAEIIKKYQQPPIPLDGASDTYFAYQLIKNANRLGFIKDSCYRYYIYGKGKNTVTSVGRFDPDYMDKLDVLFLEAQDIAKERLITVTTLHEMAIYGSHLSYVNNALRLLNQSADGPMKKLEYLATIMNNHYLEQSLSKMRRDETGMEKQRNGVIDYCYNIMLDIGKFKMIKGKPWDRAVKRYQHLFNMPWAS